MDPFHEKRMHSQKTFFGSRFSHFSCINPLNLQHKCRCQFQKKPIPACWRHLGEQQITSRLERLIREEVTRQWRHCNQHVHGVKAKFPSNPWMPSIPTRRLKSVGAQDIQQFIKIKAGQRLVSLFVLGSTHQERDAEGMHDRCCDNSAVWKDLSKRDRAVKRGVASEWSDQSWWELAFFINTAISALRVETIPRAAQPTCYWHPHFLQIPTEVPLPWFRGLWLWDVGRFVGQLWHDTALPYPLQVEWKGLINGVGEQHRGPGAASWAQEKVLQSAGAGKTSELHKDRRGTDF